MGRIFKIIIFTVFICSCTKAPRSIVAEPLDLHDREQDHAYCDQYAKRYGVVNMDPLMSGSGMENFPDKQRQVQLYEACMQKKGYRFQ